LNFTDRRLAFRRLLTGHAVVHPASVFDPISARIAFDLGCACAILAGSVASLAVLGAPDNTTLTLSEFEGLITRITRAAAIPLLVDADHGYGNALNVQRTVVELERAGVAALTIEDTDLPQPFGTTAPRLVSRDEGLGKIGAALTARTDPALVIIGRTSACAISGIEDAVDRATLYAKAGVDALFFTGVTTKEQLAALHAASPLPIILGGSAVGLGDVATQGVRIALRGHQPIHAAFAAVFETLRALEAGTSLPALPDAAFMARVTRAEQDQK
jgi:carboxyvinyl-carboxyphosphonate phosphorylmutase